jgi:hypothetical protein
VPTARGARKRAPARSAIAKRTSPVIDNNNAALYVAAASRMHVSQALTGGRAPAQRARNNNACAYGNGEGQRGASHMRLSVRTTLSTACSLSTHCGNAHTDCRHSGRPTRLVVRWAHPLPSDAARKLGCRRRIDPDRRVRDGIGFGRASSSNALRYLLDGSPRGFVPDQPLQVFASDGKITLARAR